jgi:hypothetical protein
MYPKHWFEDKITIFLISYLRLVISYLLLVLDNIDTALGGYFRKEILGQEDMYKCENCKQKEG